MLTLVTIININKNLLLYQKNNMTIKIKISNEEIKELINIEKIDFPKYTTQIINIANQNAKWTSPKVVWQMSNLIQEFPWNKFEDWKNRYLEKNPEAIKNATNKIIDMITNLKNAFDKIDNNLIKNWVEDLVIVKTFIWLKFQEAILKKISRLLNLNYKLAIPEEESKWIDWYIWNIPVSIKPNTYKTKKSLNEIINVKIIYYEKKKDWISIEFDWIE